MKNYLIITTISSPNNNLKDIAALSFANNCLLVIVGDKKTPNDFQLSNSIYLSLEKQREFNEDFAKILPFNHYSRKNIGYLFVMSQSPEYIQETDDDNIPYTKFWHKPSAPKISLNSDKNVWYNVYKHFLKESSNIWPRGFPLEEIRQSSILVPEINVKLKTFVYQGLANENADVDAIYRLIDPLPITFLEKDTIQLGKNVWCPFNSQNTIFMPEAFPLMYLPSTCSFRMTDIWRSFIAQRCLWEMEAGVAFHSATVKQERNEHNLLHNFKDEVPGYLGNEKIKELLVNCKLSKKDVYSNLHNCYETLIMHKYFRKEEMDILEQWIKLCKKKIKS